MWSTASFFVKKNTFFFDSWFYIHQQVKVLNLIFCVHNHCVHVDQGPRQRVTCCLLPRLHFQEKKKTLKKGTETGRTTESPQSMVLRHVSMVRHLFT